MGAIHRIRRWYKFNHGDAEEMLDAGADLEACPHCDTETPVYRTEYNWKGEPLTFSVCVWCDGLIEYGDLVAEPRAPYERHAKPELGDPKPRPHGRRRRTTGSSTSTPRRRSTVRVGEPTKMGPGYRLSWLQF